MDFHAAFEAGPVVAAGELAVTSGRTTAVIPKLQGTRALSREVPNGTYTIEVLANGALARVVFAAGAPVDWELAVRDGQDVRALRPGQLYGDVVGPIGAFPTRVAPSDYAAIFDLPSGRSYPSWWGLDENGAVLQLVTEYADGPWERPALPDDPAFRHAWAIAQVTAMRSHAMDGRALWRTPEATRVMHDAYEELLRLEDDAVPALAEVLTQLGTYRERDTTMWLWITLARDLARFEACQPMLARWLPRAPRLVAKDFVQWHGGPTHMIRHMQEHFAHVYADVMATLYDDSPIKTAIMGLVELETGREPFFALLTRIARRSDSVGEAARSVLARWFGS